LRRSPTRPREDLFMTDALDRMADDPADLAATNLALTNTAAGPGARDAAGRVASRGTESSTRRTVLRGLAVAGAIAGTPMLAAACGDGEAGGSGNSGAGGGTGDNSGDRGMANESEEMPEDSDPNGDAGDAEDGGDSGGGSGGEGTALARTSDIKVGGGVIIAEEELVITQPEEGTFIGLSAL